MNTIVNKIAAELKLILQQVIEEAALQKGQILVIGCSTSTVLGELMGTAGSTEVAAILHETITALAAEKKVFVAFQCCEHLNRSLVVEREIAERHCLTEVCALPQVKAGGALATRAYQKFGDPVLVESIQGDAAVDIGGTLIGMHIRPVAVPIKLKQKSVGGAVVTAARSRPKLIGGVRACYPV